MNTIWCEACADHYETDHFDTRDGSHGIGEDYGSYGALLARAYAYDPLVEKLKKFADKAWVFRGPPGGYPSPLYAMKDEIEDAAEFLESIGVELEQGPSYR